MPRWPSRRPSRRPLRSLAQLTELTQPSPLSVPTRSGALFDGKLGHEETDGAGQFIANEIGWPQGPKKASTIAAANAQLDNLARVLSERGVAVTRPAQIDWTQPLETPFFKVRSCVFCPPPTQHALARATAWRFSHLTSPLHRTAPHPSPGSRPVLLHLPARRAGHRRQHRDRGVDEPPRPLLRGPRRPPDRARPLAQRQEHALEGRAQGRWLGTLPPAAASGPFSQCSVSPSAAAPPPTFVHRCRTTRVSSPVNPLPSPR